MSNIPGTNIAAPIVPFTEDDVYPTHYAAYGKGGWKSVEKASDREGIPLSLLENGSVVYVMETQIAYVFVNGGWLTLAGDKVDKSTEISTTGGILRGGGQLSANISLTVVPASAQDVREGMDATKVVTPASLSGITTGIDSLGSLKADKTTRVNTGGLLSGGGALTGDVTISLSPATAQEVGEAKDATKVVTPASLSDIVETVDGISSFMLTVATSLINTQTILVDRFGFK